MTHDPILRLDTPRSFGGVISSRVASLKITRSIVASRACLNESGVVHGRLVAQMPIEAADEVFLRAFRDELAASRTRSSTIMVI